MAKKQKAEKGTYKVCAVISENEYAQLVAYCDCNEKSISQVVGRLIYKLVNKNN